MMLRSAAVLGAGTMGAQIAAHFANAGVPTLLLDLTPDVARQGLERAKALKPDPFFTAETVSLISTGSFEADLGKASTADWILEAILEQLDAKRALLARVEQVRGAMFAPLVTPDSYGTVPIRAAPGTNVEWQVTLEDGSAREGRARVEHHDRGDVLWLDHLPDGYHKLVVRAGDTRAEAHRKLEALHVAFEVVRNLVLVREMRGRRGERHAGKSAVACWCKKPQRVPTFGTP